MKNLFYFLCLGTIMLACQQPVEENADALAKDIRNEFIRTWNAYKTFAWGHDVLLPLSKSHEDWYEESLHISPIDAYSTMKVLELNDQAMEIERYIIDSVHWDKDLFVKTFEVNIRILGGLLAMYQYTRDPVILEKTEDFGNRMLAAFNSPSGIPYFWFNLKTGETRGNQVNVAEAASYLIEMGVLSYYTSNPAYYTAARKASMAVWERTSERNLVGEVINVETGEWINENSHICAGIDSYYEYLYKAWLLFGDPELKEIWDGSIQAIQTYLADESDNTLWYRRVNMYTAEETSTVVTLYDAFFPAILALSGDLHRAEKNQDTWFGLWNKYGLEPMVYDYKTGEPNYPVYDLNPEIIESAYYLYHITGEVKYFNMAEKFWADIKKYCRNDIAFSSVEDVRTMIKRDYMPTFFLAETLKYFYLIFTEYTGAFNLDDYVFNTEAHPFRKSDFNTQDVKRRLGLQPD